MPESIQVAGLKQFSRSLRKINADLPKALRVALNDAVGLIVDDARPRIPRRSGRAANTLKARSTRTEARVQGGSKRVPYFSWLDFGGRVGRNKSVRRAFLKEGRYIYKSYARTRGEFSKALTNALIAVAKTAGMDVEA